MPVWKRVAAAIAAFAGAGGANSAVPEGRYAEGQVWEYRARPGDEASRLRIQKIEPFPAVEGGKAYHIAIAGVNLGSQARSGIIQHVPVSQATLDASVTRLSSVDLDFGDVEEGIAEWRRAEGGVFTISVAKIVEVMVETLATGHPPAD